MRDAGGSLSAVDRGRLVELERTLADIRQPAHGRAVMQQVVDLVGIEYVGRWGFDVEQEKLCLRETGSAGPLVPASYVDELASGLRTGEFHFAFSATAPERAQRNKTVLFAGARKTLTLRRDEAARLGLTSRSYRAILPGLEGLIALHERHHIADHRQMRTLICDGRLVICYLNVLQAREFTPRQRRLYARVVAAVRRRALLQHRLGAADASRAAFGVAFEALGRAAFIVNEHGAVLEANALGTEAVDREPGLARAVAEAMKYGSTEFDVIPVRDSGVPHRFMVLSRRVQLATVAQTIATELGLGVRATEVFVRVAAGEPTKTVAMRLGIATNTVEYHLTQIYRRLGLGSRGELQCLLLERLIGARRRGA
jgi:DNA-binding CsgD family transcriptional regulator